MRFKKILGAVAVTALIALVGSGTASATTLTSPTGTQYSGTIKGELAEGESVLKSSFIGEVKCSKSTLQGNATTSGAGVTVQGAFSSFTLTSCNGTVTVLKNGSLEIHHTSGYNGTLTLSGLETTVELFGLHCVYAIPPILVGVIVGGAIAIIAVAVALSRIGGRSGAFCGSSANWSAKYKLTTPQPMYVDA